MSNKEYEYNEKIHATIINPYLSKDQFDDICDLIKKYSIRNISTSLLYLKDVKESLSNLKINIKTYISYPLSDLPSNCLNDLINFAKEHGANEIEYIPKFFLLSKKDEESFANDIEKVSSSNLPITLIFNKERLENKYFNRALDISLELGIRNFQVGDGFSSTISFIKIKEVMDLLNQTNSIKIVGGINNLSQVDQLLNAGVDCIGSSNFYEIFREIKSN